MNQEIQATLKITAKEFNQLINNRYDCKRFEEVFNDIPMYHPEHEPEAGETHRDFMEDDGREYRWLIIKDLKTGVEHCINTIYHPEYPNDAFETPSSILIVETDEESDLYVKPEPVVVPKEILSPEAQADKDLWANYQAIKHECRQVEPKERLKVPKARIDEILNLLKSKNFNMYQLRAVVIPVCIDYKLEDVTFWRWIQNKSYSGRK